MGFYTRFYFFNQFKITLTLLKLGSYIDVKVTHFRMKNMKINQNKKSNKELITSIPVKAKTPTNEATCCCYFHIQNLVFKKVGLKMLKIMVKKTLKSVVLNPSIRLHCQINRECRFYLYYPLLCTIHPYSGD